MFLIKELPSDMEFSLLKSIEFSNLDILSSNSFLIKKSYASTDQ